MSYQKERERQAYIRDQVSRDNDNSSRGILLGLLLAALLGAPLVWYFLSQRNNEVPTQQNPTIILPNSDNANPAPQVQERVIERENNTITVPSNEAPIVPPDVNITVPSNPSGSSTETAPSTSGDTGSSTETAPSTSGEAQ